ncbi:MAG: MarR family transcriptional regulator [Nocardioides sp.]|nr:MarR family transcriptional regulator [Nocardioides sp.]
MGTPEELLDRTLLLTTLLSADMDAFSERTGLSQARIHLLWVLGAEGPVTQRALAAALGVTPRNVTGLVDGLERSGHVTREPHPDDRRALLVTPTALGAEVVATLTAGHRDLADALFGSLSAADRRRFGAMLDDVVASLVQALEEQR